MSCANLNLFETDPDKFLLRFVTVSIISPQNPNNSPNNGSTLAHPHQRRQNFCQLGRLWPHVFGMLMFSYGRYLQNRQTVNGTYYASLLRQLRENNDPLQTE